MTLPEEALPATLNLNPELHMSDDECYEFCMANPDVWFERTAEGEIVIVLPVGLESNHQESEIIEQLRPWAKTGRSRQGLQRRNRIHSPHRRGIFAGRCMGL